MLSFTGFNKSYGYAPVLKIPDLVIAHGIHWVAGNNGSGKSTLLRSLAGILPFDGNIVLNKSIDLKKDAVHYRRLVNFADAEPAFPEFLTGMEMLQLFRDAKDGNEMQLQYLVKSMKINDFLDHPVGTYSSGMLKKLSLVLAFMGSPVVILLDEPLITLDIASLPVLYEWILEWHTRQNTSFIISSHYPLKIPHTTVQRLLVKDQTLIIA